MHSGGPWRAPFNPLAQLCLRQLQDVQYYTLCLATLDSGALRVCGCVIMHVFMMLCACIETATDGSVHTVWTCIDNDPTAYMAGNVSMICGCVRSVQCVPCVRGCVRSRVVADKSTDSVCSCSSTSPRCAWALVVRACRTCEQCTCVCHISVRTQVNALKQLYLNVLHGATQLTGLQPGAVVGIAIGVVVLLVVLIVAVCWCVCCVGCVLCAVRDHCGRDSIVRRRRRRAHARRTDENDDRSDKLLGMSCVTGACSVCVTACAHRVQRR
jgi:hypothetical protein